ncbi:MAG: PAS domain S-box protein [Actinobacteria bacterium]|nr:PAS domain S-box protein [Actinomycetota bacterium]
MFRLRKKKHDPIPHQIGMPRQLLDAVGTPLILISPDMDILFMNERARELLDTVPGETGKLKDIMRVVVSEERDYVSSMIKSGFSGENVQLGFNTRIRKATGEIVHVHMITSVLAAEGKSALIITLNDVTERESAEERYRTLVEHSSDAILIVGLKGEILSSNAATTAFFGFSPEELEGEELLNLISLEEESTHPVNSGGGEGKDGEAVKWPAEFRARAAIGGSERLLEVTTAGIGGRDVGRKTLVMINDITEREKARRRLDMSEERYQTIVEETKEAIVMVNRGGEIVYANPAAETMFDTTLVEARGKSVFQYIDPVDKDKGNDELRKVLETGRPGRNVSLRCLRTDEAKLDVEVSTGIVGWPGDDAVVLFVIRDVTERLKAEAEKVLKLKMKEANARITSVFVDQEDTDAAIKETLEIIVNLLDVSHAFYMELSRNNEEAKIIDHVKEGLEPGEVDINEITVERFGWAYEKLSNRQELVISNVDLIEGAKEKETAEKYLVESIVIMPLFEGPELRRVIGCDCIGNEKEWLDQEIDFIRGAAAAVSQSLERKRWVEELSKSQQFLENVTENIAEGLMVLHNGTITWVNSQMCELYGYTKEELVGKTPEILIQDSDYLKNYVLEMMEMLYKTGRYVSEEKAVHKNGTVFDVQVSLALIGSPDQSVVETVVAVKDITQDKQMREEAATTAEAYSTIFSSVGDGLIVHTVDGEIIDANERASLYSGYARDELLMMNLKDLVPRRFESAYEKSKGEVLREGFSVFETELRKKEGLTFPVEASMKQTMIWGKTVLLSLLRDITERKKAEEEDMKRTLQLASLNEVVKASASSLDLDIVAESILNVALDVSGADTGVVVLETPPGGRVLSAVAFVGCPHEYQVMFNQEFLARTCMDVASSPEGATIMGRDRAREWLGIVDAMRKSNSVEMLFIPLKSGEKLVGVIALGSKRRDIFVSRDKDFYNAIGAEIGVSIENALIYRELAAEHERLSLLYRSAQSISGELELGLLLGTTVQKASRAVRAESGIIGLLEPGSYEIHWSSSHNVDLDKLVDDRTTVKKGIGGLVLREKRALLISPEFNLPDGLEKELQSDPIVKALGATEFVVVPLISKDRVVGIICLVVEGGARRLSNEDALLLEAMGRQAGVAIENAKLYEETRKHLEALEEAHRELMVLDMMKSDFVSTVSHELRSPLAVIGGFAKTLVEHYGEIDRETERESMSIILEKSIALEGLIENILDMSRIEEGRLGVTIKQFNLVELAQATCNDLGMASEKHKIQLNPAFHNVEVVADPEKVEVALGNLIRNAIKFSPEGGFVTVSVGLTDGLAEVSVRDEGVGIPEEELEKIFDRFYQVESHEARSFSGSGLGLYITRELLHVMNGEISVESELGKGSVFIFRLPLAGLYEDTAE